MIGTRDPAKTLAVNQPDAMGNPPFKSWQKDHSSTNLVVFAEAAARGEFVINALHGGAALEVLKKVEAGLEGKVLIDISNPLDFSKGMPPSLFVSNTDSLGEQIQRSLPKTNVVKTLNTMSALLQVNPRGLADGDHHAFISGNDTSAKGQVIQILKEWYGWRNIIDLGDITTARGVEMLFPMWVRLWTALQTPLLNYRIVT
jgi:hypothetical protein